MCATCERRLRAWELRQRQSYWQPPLPLFPWGIYRHDLKRAIATLKYNGHPELGTLLGEWLAMAWHTGQLGRGRSLQVVPIPLHRDKLKARGFNQAEVIAASFCRTLELPLIPNGLVRQCPTQSMFQLTVAQRQANLKQAFALGQGLRQQRWVLLCDDIYTTGTTARAAASTLAAAGYRVLGIVTVAIALPETLAPLTHAQTHEHESFDPLHHGTVGIAGLPPQPALKPSGHQQQ